MISKSSIRSKYCRTLIFTTLALYSGISLEAKTTLERSEDSGIKNRETAKALIKKAESTPKFKQYLETAVDLLDEKDIDLIWKANTLLCARRLKSERFDGPNSRERLEELSSTLWSSERQARQCGAAPADIANIQLTNVEALLALRKYDVSKSMLDRIKNSSDTTPGFSDELRFKLMSLLSRTYLHLYRFDQAKICAQEALEVAKIAGFKSTDENIRLLNNDYGLICAQEGDNQKAIEYFDKALADGSCSIRSQVLTNKAISLYRTGNLEDSKNILSQIITFSNSSEHESSSRSKKDEFDLSGTFDSQILKSIQPSRACIAYGIVLSKLKEYNLSEEYLKSIKIKYIDNIHAPLVSEELLTLLSPDIADSKTKSQLKEPLFKQKRRFSNDPNQYSDFLTLYDTVLEIDPLLEAEALQAVAENDLNKLQFESWLSCLFQPKSTNRTDTSSKIIDNWPVTTVSTDYHGFTLLNALLLKQAVNRCANSSNQTVDPYIEDINKALYLNCYHSGGPRHYKLNNERLKSIAILTREDSAKLSEVYLLQSWLALNNQKYKQAIELSEQCLNLLNDPRIKTSENMEKIGIKTRIIAACCKINSGDFEGAEPFAEEALRLAENAEWIRMEDLNLSAHFLAYCYKHNEHFEKLENLCLKFLEKPNPYEKDYFRYLIYSLLRQEKYKQCIEYSKKLENILEKAAKSRPIPYRLWQKNNAAKPENKYDKFAEDELSLMLQIYNSCVVAWDRLQNAEKCLSTLEEYLRLNQKRYGEDAIGLEGIKHVLCLRSDPSFKIKPPKTYLHLADRHACFKYFKKGTQIKTYLEPGKYKDTECGEQLKELTMESLECWNRALKGDIKFVPTENKKEANLLVNFDSSASSYQGAAYCRWRWKHFCYKPKMKSDIETAEIDYFCDVHEGFQSYVLNNFNFHSSKRTLSKYESIQFKMITLHELGHVLGLSHSPYSSHLMFYGVSVDSLPEADVASARLQIASVKESK